MKDAFIVSTARTPIGRAYKGAFNDLEAPSLGAIAIKAALSKSNVTAEQVDDVIEKLIVEILVQMQKTMQNACFFCFFGRVCSLCTVCISCHVMCSFMTGFTDT